MANVRKFARRPTRNQQKFDTKKKFGVKQRRWKIEDDEIAQLKDLYETVQPQDLKLFTDFPLSEKTKKGLQHAKYTEPTEIQHESVMLSLRGNDILGAAKTGSGKTLAFVIPILEVLFRAKWNPLDGLGALVITPTRELAYQIFEVLRLVGRFHDFSAGLVIGGKHIKEESEKINQTNIVICTPGRLLQHMDETTFFNADNMQILVLDEADRILDLGFQQSMNAIIENLPKKRQTLLYSATQTKSVKDLARLSLKEPMYVSVHEKSEHSTPSKLTQSYVVCELHDKFNFLWSFIKNHMQSKILVFLSSCKQVRYVNEIFRKLRPGINVMSLHGAMQQLKRIAMYDSFVRKQHAVMFATDIAARGLDFPAINWVVQLDCPEDANTYIHRAGRTARYKDDGEALLVLLPSEQPAMVQELSKKKIPINEIKVNPKKLWSIQGKIESICASEITMKEFAQRAFVSYLKSVFLMSNKKVFDVTCLDTNQYARSVGLAIAPRVRFIQKKKLSMQKKAKGKQGVHSLEDTAHCSVTDRADNQIPASSPPAKSDSSDSDEESDQNEMPGTSGTGTGHEAFDFSGGGADNDDDIYTVKRREIQFSSSDQSLSSEEEEQSVKSAKSSKKKSTSKAALAKKLMKKNITTNVKVIFDEEGKAVVDAHKKTMSTERDDDIQSGINIEKARQRMVEEDTFDKQLYREKIKQRHREQRFKEKEKKRKQRNGDEEEQEEPIAVLGNPQNDSEQEGHDGNESDDNDVDSVEYRVAQVGSDGSDSSGTNESAEDSAEEAEDNASNSSDVESSDGNDGPEPKRPRTCRKSDVTFDTGLSLMDDEEIALKLLNS